MKNAIYIIFSLVLSCDFTDANSIFVKNESSKTIYSLVSKIELVDLNDPAEASFILEVRPLDFTIINPTLETWEEFIADCDGKVVRLYIIDKEYVDQEGWQKVFRENKYKKIVVLSIEDLSKDNEVVFKSIK